MLCQKESHPFHLLLIPGIPCRLLDPEYLSYLLVHFVRAFITFTSFIPSFRTALQLTYSLRLLGTGEMKKNTPVLRSNSHAVHSFLSLTHSLHALVYYVRSVFHSQPSDPKVICIYIKISLCVCVCVCVCVFVFAFFFFCVCVRVSFLVGVGLQG